MIKIFTGVSFARTRENVGELVCQTARNSRDTIASKFFGKVYPLPHFLKIIELSVHRTIL